MSIVSYSIASFGGVNVHGASSHDATVPQLPFIVEGYYVGDNTQNRAVAHLLSRVPKQVIIMDTTSSIGRNNVIVMNCPDGDVIEFLDTAGTTAASFYGVTSADATNFYVGAASGLHGNVSGRTYHFMAV